MKTKSTVWIWGGAGLLIVIVLLVVVQSSSLESARASQKNSHQIATVETKLSQAPQAKTTAAVSVAQSEPLMESFELIEKKYAQLSLAEARKEVRRIDSEANLVALKNFDDFTVVERVTYLNRQREKAVLLNKIILARLESVQK